MKKNKNGFTLLELVIVIAVVAILASILIPTFAGIINRSRLSNDTMLCKNLNTSAAAMQISTNGTSKSTHEVLNAMAENGFTIEKLKTTNSENVIVYDSINYRFFVYDYVNNKVSYKDESTTINLTDKPHKVNYWIISDTYDQTNDNLKDFSIYLKDGYTGETTLDISTGLDVGSNTNIEKINYTNTGASQNVTIRTNSSATILTITGPEDDVVHYGEVGALNIVAVKKTSYHENGKVGFAEIKTGRIVLEHDADIEHIHINSNGSNAFDEVIIKDNGTKKTPKAITRDEVTVSTATLVVKVEAVNGAQEEVYVYADGNSGTTEKTPVQNTDVVSVLGVLVLDNGTTNGALNATEKEAVKDEVASDSVTADFTSQEGNGDYVARIGRTGYMALQTAIDEAVDGNTIYLLKDVALSSSDYLLVNKDITLNMGEKAITGAHDPMIVVGASAGTYQPNSSQLTHAGHLVIKGNGSISSTNWDMICIFPDASVDVYDGTFTGFKATFYINGGTLNTYGGNFTATSPSNTYIIQVKGAGSANIIAGNFTTPASGGYGVYLDNASESNFGSTTGEGPTFNTWRACIASNGSESHSVLANIYSGTYNSYRSDASTEEQSVIQLANATNETQTLNIYGGTFEQTGTKANRSIFNIRYKGVININISGGRFVVPSGARLFNGVGSTGSGWPTTSNVHLTVTNNALSAGTYTVEVYSSGAHDSTKDFEFVIG